jgi:hypothetical protein
MRTIFKLCLVAAVVAAVGLVAVPITSANAGAKGHASLTTFEKKQNKRIKKAKKQANKAHNRIENIKDWNFFQDGVNGTQQDSINSLTGTVNAIVAGVPDIIGGLEALQKGLVALQGALEDPVTGLLGLNLARPQFGVFDPTGNFLGGTSDAGANGPTDDATVSGSFYVIDFGNDVSTRIYHVNVFPAGPGVTPPISSIGSCATTGIDALCEGIKTDSGGDVNQIVVQFGAGGSVPATPFTVTAISG